MFHLCIRISSILFIIKKKELTWIKNNLEKTVYNAVSILVRCPIGEIWREMPTYDREWDKAVHFMSLFRCNLVFMLISSMMLRIISEINLLLLLRPQWWPMRMRWRSRRSRNGLRISWRMRSQRVLRFVVVLCENMLQKRRVRTRIL